MARSSTERKKHNKETEVIMLTDSDSDESFTSEEIDWDAPEPNLIFMPSSCTRFVSIYIDYLCSKLTVDVIWCP